MAGRCGDVAGRLFGFTAGRNDVGWRDVCANGEVAGDAILVGAGMVSCVSGVEVDRRYASAGVGATE